VRDAACGTTHFSKAHNKTPTSEKQQDYSGQQMDATRRTTV